MKLLKILGLGAVATALMAFVGASSASATVLCKTTGINQAGQPTGTTCPANQAYPAGTEIHAVLQAGQKAILTDSNTNPIMSCESSTIQAKTVNEGNATETVKATISELDYTKCGTSEVTVIKKGTLEFHWIDATHNATLIATESEVTTVTPSIFGNVHCIAATNHSDTGKVTGGSPAVMETESAALNQLSTSALCPSAAEWDAKYEISSPSPFYVTGHT